MAVLARSAMGAVAAAAVAVATWCAAVAYGGPAVGDVEVPAALLGVALAAGAAGAAARRSANVLPPGRDVYVLTGVTVVGYVGLYLAGWADQDHLGEITRILPLAVAGLGLLWPEPKVLRYSLLLAAGSLLGGALAGDQSPARWAVGASLVALAVALVATNRLTAASGPPLGGPVPAPTSGRRVATEAAALLAVVALLAALAAALVPPPPGQGGGGDRDPTRLVEPAAPVLDFDDRLGVGGGRGKRGDEVVLVVTAPAPEVWRATTYDHWDGEFWERSPEVLADVDQYLRPGVGDLPLDAPGDLVLEFPQLVTVQARSASVLVAAAQAAYVAADTALRQGEDGSLYPTLPLARGESYLAYSRRSFAGADELRAAWGPVPPAVSDAYLQLPQVAPGVRALAADVAGNEPTVYDKVRALEGWLLTNTTVTDAARPVPPGTDPLEAFLLTERSGPPERTATALAVMLRALGVPARMAVGFLPGTRTGPGGEFVVRLRDTHAWVEVWFPGIGWQRFDPTGMAPAPGRDQESVWDRLWRFLRGLWPVLVAAVLIAGAWLARRALRRWRYQRSRPWAARFLAQLERAGAARGRPRRPPETPAEYARSLSRTVLPDPRIEEVGELVTVGAYSRGEPAEAERARADEVLRAATRAAPVRRLRRVHRWSAPARPTIRKP